MMRVRDRDRVPRSALDEAARPAGRTGRLVPRPAACVLCSLPTSDGLAMDGAAGGANVGENRVLGVAFETHSGTQCEMCILAAPDIMSGGAKESLGSRAQNDSYVWACDI